MVRLRQQNSSFLLLETSRIKRKIDGNSYLINRYFGRGYCYAEKVELFFKHRYWFIHRSFHWVRNL